MSAVLCAIVGIAFVELLVRTHFVGTAYALLDTGSRATHVVTSKRISDHWKERAVLAYSGTMMRCTLRLGLVLLAAAAAVWGLGLLSRALIDLDLLQALTTWQGLAVSTAAALVYAAIAGRREAHADEAADEAGTGDYTATDKLLHRVALSSAAVREMTFDLEMAAGGRATTAETVTQRHVFVAGLARAGTTVLMRSLHASGAFRSLTYRDMPFVLMPNLWGRVAALGARDRAAGERAHGDGIAVDFDSPEALEEVFWKTFCGDAFLQPDRLVPHHVDDETVDRFRDYIDAVVRSDGADGRRRYLSKNNNNILRLPAIAEALPESVIVVPFREPVQQALSLKRQHERFAAQGRDDPFVRRYMQWLGHHEFGPDHRPFCMDEDAFAALAQHRPEGLDYWLLLWCQVYRHLLATAPARAVFLSYERVCDNATGAWPALLEQVDCRAAETDGRAPQLQASFRTPGALPDRALCKDADAVHGALLERSL